MAVTREGLPKVVLAGAAAAPALLLVRAVLLLRHLTRQDVERAALLPVALIAGLLAAVAILPMLALRCAPARRANLALAVASAAVVLYAAELALGGGTVIGGGLWGERLRVAEAMDATGAPAYPSIEPVKLVWSRAAGAPPALDVGGVPILPLAARARSRLVSCRVEPDGDWRVYETDEHGFFNPPGLWGRPSVTLAAVGDSFTAGTCVPSESSMVAGLRRRFPDAMNLGMPGNGPLLMLGVVREYLPALRPRQVLWCHYAGNDLLDLRREMSHPLLRRYLEDGFRQGLLPKQDVIDRALDVYLERYLRPARPMGPRLGRYAGDGLALREVRSRIGLVFADPSDSVPTEEEYALFAAVLQRVQQTVAGWGGQVRFVYLPADQPRWHPARAAEVALIARARARTLAVARRLSIPVIDVEAAFEREPEPDALYACPGCHYSPRGYALAARVVLEALDGGPR